MKTIRNSLFETNSSSVHSLTYDLNQVVKFDEILNLDLPFIGCSDVDVYYTDTKEKLAIIALAFIDIHGFQLVYGYLNGFYTNISDRHLADFKKLLNDYGVKTINFQWKEAFGYECDDWLMEEITEEWDYQKMKNFIEHATVLVTDRG